MIVSVPIKFGAKQRDGWSHCDLGAIVKFTALTLLPAHLQDFLSLIRNFWPWHVQESHGCPHWQTFCIRDSHLISQQLANGLKMKNKKVHQHWKSHPKHYGKQQTSFYVIRRYWIMYYTGIGLNDTYTAIHFLWNSPASSNIAVKLRVVLYIIFTSCQVAFVASSKRDISSFKTGFCDFYLYTCWK